MSARVRRWQAASTLAVLALAATSSLLGLLAPWVYAGEGLARTRAEDAVLLAVGVPALAAGLWYARRGSERGRIVWLGALAFLAYMALSRALSLPFYATFLLTIAQFALALVTLVGAVADTDARGLRERVGDRLNERRYAGVLAIIAVGLAALWLSDVVAATLSGTTPAIVEAFGPRGLGTVVVDLGVVVPALAVAAVLLWWRRPHGYVAGGTLLVFGALLAPNLAAITLVDIRGGVAVTPGIVVGTVLPPLLAAAFAAGFLRAIPAGGPEGVS